MAYFVEVSPAQLMGYGPALTELAEVALVVQVS